MGKNFLHAGSCSPYLLGSDWTLERERDLKIKSEIRFRFRFFAHASSTLLPRLEPAPSVLLWQCFRLYLKQKPQANLPGAHFT